jgi:dUTP pyrophosphatase
MRGNIQLNVNPSFTLFILPTTDDAKSYYANCERSNDNAGVDLYVPEDVVFAPGERKLVSMCVKAVMERAGFRVSEYPCDGCNDNPEEVHYWMAPRSSLSKTGLILCNSMGVIDHTYRGELMAFLWNSTEVSVTVKKGDRLVQILAPNMGHIAYVQVVNELSTTARGEGGFGSTGR